MFLYLVPNLKQIIDKFRRRSFFGCPLSIATDRAPVHSLQRHRPAPRTVKRGSNTNRGKLRRGAAKVGPAALLMNGYEFVPSLLGY